MNHSTLHSVFQTNQSNSQQSNFEAVQSGKKKKKQKMVRADPSLLGEQGLTSQCGGHTAHHLAVSLGLGFSSGNILP